MKPHFSSKHHQRGAIAIMTGLMAIVLIAFLGITVDLGHTYIEKSELQNAADAAALAGAKELNQTAAGVTAAINKAIEIAAHHSYNFSTPVTITSANIRIGSCPNAGNTNTFGRPSSRLPDCTFIPAGSATTNVLAAGMTFVEVDTSNLAMNTYFMRVASAAFSTTATFGYAVAGRFMQDVTPIGVCAVDPLHVTDKYTYADGSTELLELGFRRGISYDLIALNPLGGASGTPMLINPVDAPPGACQPSHSSASFTAPFICQGNSAVATDLSAASQVYVNTGFSAGPVEKALNSRFDIFGGGSPCSASSAPPDINIKQYCWDNTAGDCTPPPSRMTARDWMQPGASTVPSHQTVNLDIVGATHKPYYWPPHDPAAIPPIPPAVANFGNYGVLWSYTHAYHADASTPPKAGTPFDATNPEWAKLYNLNAATFGGFNLLDPSYPTSAGAGFVAGTPAAPYNQVGSTYWQSPGNPGVKNRRLLHIVILDCTAFVGAGGLSCQSLPVKGIGRFFMQRKADLTGSPKRIETEFAGLVEPVPMSDIKLFR